MDNDNHRRAFLNSNTPMPRPNFYFCFSSVNFFLNSDGRASAMNLWFGQSQKMCGHLNATILALNHETGNPQTHYVSYYGGGPVGYDFKYSFQLRHWHRKLDALPEGCECLNPEIEKAAERVLISHRFPARADRGASVLLKLDSKGFTC